MRERSWEVGHIALAHKADLVLVAPTTANLMAKMAHGIADDMLTTTLLATKAPVLLAPANEHRHVDSHGHTAEFASFT